MTEYTSVCAQQAIDAFFFKVSTALISVQFNFMFINHSRPKNGGPPFSKISSSAFYHSSLRSPYILQVVRYFYLNMFRD